MNNGGRAGLNDNKQSISEREERIGRDDRSLGHRRRQFQFLRGILRLARGDARGIDPAHLSRADADGRQIFRIDDGVGFDVLGDTECEFQIVHFGIGRCAFRCDL